MNMIWEFKRSLYCTEQRRSIESCRDLGSPTLRTRLQAHFDAKGTFPRPDADDEYAHYFERAYPSEGDRRRYLDRHVSGGRPSYAHEALAALMQAGIVKLVWTVNFDRLVEDAAATTFGTTSRLIVATLDSSQIAEEAMNEDRWPLLVKLHGDFHSQRLKNVAEELRAQDMKLRDCLVGSSRKFGLAVVGYSGRDCSVMDAMDQAADQPNPFPGGLFWFHRADRDPVERVLLLLERVKAAGSEATLIEIETFDELMADVVRALPDLPVQVLARLDEKAPRVSNLTLPPTTGDWPIVRLNALPVEAWPTTCRRIEGEIGGTREVREAIERTGAEVVAGRRKVGVIAFGRDAEVKKVFEGGPIKTFDLHTIEPGRLRYESAEHGLLYDALCRALTRERPLFESRRGRLHLLGLDLDRAKTEGSVNALRSAANALGGVVAGTGLPWREAIEVRLEFRFQQLWLLYVPTVWVEMPDGDEHRVARSEFIRSRVADRYNRQVNRLLDAWKGILVGDAPRATVHAFGIGDGVDAAFTIRGRPPFSWRAKTS